MIYHTATKFPNCRKVLSYPNDPAHSSCLYIHFITSTRVQLFTNRFLVLNCFSGVFTEDSIGFGHYWTRPNSQVQYSTIFDKPNLFKMAICSYWISAAKMIQLPNFRDVRKDLCKDRIHIKETRVIKEANDRSIT